MGVFFGAKTKISKKIAAIVCIVSLVASSVQPAFALPAGGQVVGGNASISANANQMNVNQSTNNAIINWDSFDISSPEHVNFSQPSASAITLNRVTGGGGQSGIYGKLTANGNVVIVNPHGVMFGGGSQVNVGGLVASTADITNENFMAGNYKFNKTGNANAVIKNNGSITIKDTGIAAMVAPNVVNNGIIEAKLGKVQLGSGDSFSLDLHGDGLINLQASGDIKNQLVKNSGKIEANGGSVLLTAAAAESVVSSVINMDGLILANGLGSKNGKVQLIGAKNKAGNSTVLVSGKIETKGNNGGRVEVLGNKVALLNGAKIDASGKNGGGTVLVGGDYLGGNNVATASHTVVQEGASIDVSATENGNGGKAIIWSDEYTSFGGIVTALGGMLGGNGGFVETSSKDNLQAFGNVDASAVNGNAGTWLLDPHDVTITSSDNQVTQTGGLFTPTGNAARINVQTILNALNNHTNVNVTTGSTGTTQAGNIHIASTINKTSGGDATLTLNAANNITTGNNVEIKSSSNKLGVTMNAGAAIRLDGTNFKIDTNGGAVSLNAVNNITLGNNSSIISKGGNILLKSTAGNIVLSHNNNVLNSDKASSTADGSITLVGQKFLNSAGSDAIVTGSNRLLTYTVRPENDTVDGLTSDFTRYSCTYGGACPTFPATGDGFLYSYSPVVTLTINPNPLSITYGDAVPTFTYNLSGYNGGDAATDVISGSAGWATDYTQGSDIGSYDITSLAGNLSSSLGYTFAGSTLVDGLTVVAKELSVALTGIVSKIYDGNNTATLNGGNYQLTGIYGSDAVSISNTAGTYNNKNVGTGKTVTVTDLALTGAKSGNYTLAATSVNGNIGTISKRVLNVIAAGIDKVYNGNTNATVTLTDDRIAGDKLTRSYSSASFDNKNVGTDKTVNVFGINVTGTDSGNYTFNTTAQTTADITKRALKVSALGDVKVYDGTTDAEVSLFDNRVRGDKLTTAYADADFNNKNAGILKTITVNGITLDGDDAGNYSFNTSTTTLGTILKRFLDITATGVDKIYDGNYDASVTLSDNRVSGDKLTTSYSDAYFLNKNAGTNRNIVVVGIDVSGDDAKNYTYLPVNFTKANIAQRVLNITAIGIDKTYDGNNNAAVNLSDDRVDGDVFENSYSSASFDDKNVGADKTISVFGIDITGTDAGNYTFNTTAETTADITPYSLIVTADAKTKVYGDADPTLTYTYGSGLPPRGDTEGEFRREKFNGLQGDDTAEVFSGGLTREAGENVAGSPYDILIGSLSAGANYVIDFVSNEFTITRASLNVVADNKSALFGGTTPALTYQVSGLKNKDTTEIFTGGLFTAPTSSAPGIYAIERGSLELQSNNYIMSFTPGEFTILSPLAAINAANQQSLFGPILNDAPGGSLGTLLSLLLSRRNGNAPSGNAGAPAFNFAGGLANLEPASGGDSNNSGNSLNNFEPAAGDEIIPLMDCNKTTFDESPCQI